MKGSRDTISCRKRRGKRQNREKHELQERGAEEEQKGNHKIGEDVDKGEHEGKKETRCCIVWGVGIPFLCALPSRCLHVGFFLVFFVFFVLFFFSHLSSPLSCHLSLPYFFPASWLSPNRSDRTHPVPFKGGEKVMEKTRLCPNADSAWSVCHLL